MMLPCYLSDINDPYKRVSVCLRSFHLNIKVLVQRLATSHLFAYIYHVEMLGLLGCY